MIFSSLTRISCAICLAIGPLFAAGNIAATERVANFALLDQAGVYHQLRKYGDNKAVVVIAMSSSCQQNLNLLPKYRLLQTTWESQGVAFLGIDATPDNALEDSKRLAELYGVEMPILVDSSQLVSELLELKNFGDIVVLDPERFRVFYRGGLDQDFRRAQPDQNKNEVEATHFLAQTLSDVLAGNFDSSAATVVENRSACEIPYPARDQHLTEAPDYSSEVAPLLMEKCVSCHREGGIAPFAMNSHMMVQGWAPMMKEVMLTKRMPPAQVDPSINHFTNARYMESEELQTLVHWIDAGAPRGEGLDDPLTQVSVPESEWELGEPDYIVEVPAFTVPATGVLDYENVTINLPFEEDVWVKSVQHIPGDRRVLHHLLSYIVPADYSEKIVEGENDQYREFLEGYAPGKDEAATYPDGAGMFVPKGSAVQMSLHYTTFGKETVDSTLLGLYFADEEPRYQYSTHALSHGGRNIEIPPGVEEHKMSASYVFDDEIMLHGLRPHMHYRGKHMKFRVVYPDGSQDDILNVPDYNFAWQPTYRLAEPMLLPAGSRVIIEGAFDNSQYNLGNPDPGATVRGGAQSWDEMFIGYFSYHRTEPLH